MVISNILSDTKKKKVIKIYLNNYFLKKKSAKQNILFAFFCDDFETILNISGKDLFAHLYKGK